MSLRQVGDDCGQRPEQTYLVEPGAHLMQSDVCGLEQPARQIPSQVGALLVSLERGAVDIPPWTAGRLLLHLKGKWGAPTVGGKRKKADQGLDIIRAYATQRGGR